MGCNPCYNGYGVHHRGYKKQITLVVILVIMDMVYTACFGIEEGDCVVILVIMDMVYT